MARQSDQMHAPDNTIVLYQQTIESLANNTLINDYFSVLKKMIDEGYTLNFIGYHDDPTQIQSESHLRNYFKTLAPHSLLI